MVARRTLLLLLALPLMAQQPPGQGPTPLTYAGTPLRVPFECEPERIEEMGLVCLEDEPCIVYTEFSAMRVDGSRLILAGNFHTQAATMASLLMVSEDGGVNWTEPYARVTRGSLDQIYFANNESGWVSGQIVQSLARDPFFLVTKDAAKTWRRRSIYSEPTIGTIEGFRFDTPQTGEAILLSEAHSQRWTTRNGGDTWQLNETSERKMPVPPPPAADPTWRLRSDAKLKAHVLEHQQGTRFSPVASFLIEAARCSAP